MFWHNDTSCNMLEYIFTSNLLIPHIVDACTAASDVTNIILITYCIDVVHANIGHRQWFRCRYGFL